MDVATPRKVIELSRGQQPSSLKGSSQSQPYCSILFENLEDRAAEEGLKAPEFFPDLNCDQFVDAVTKGKEEYNLKPFFQACLRRVGATTYRHEVMQDLENAVLLQQVISFAKTMHDMRERLVRVEKLYCQQQKQAWFLDAVEVYCDAINKFADDLRGTDLGSRGFLGFRDYLADYSRSVGFINLLSETEKLKADLATVNYCVLIRGDKFTVRKYAGERDYSADVEETFEKFKQGAVKNYKVSFSETEEMNHVEAKILEFVSKLHPEVFVPLDQYFVRNANYLDDTVAAFDREIQFYLAYINYMESLKRTGLHFCYPRISDTHKEVFDREGFDVVLARKLVEQNASVVCNDFCLKGQERILVISGPNQGGKTTFARAFGQMHYLASLGLPVPGKEAQLFLFDQLFTHFEKEEKVENLRGKLEDDLVRIHGILERVTPKSIVIMNEIFTSTTIQDEIFLSKKVMEQISALDLLCAWVTFVDELASYGPQTVSMVSTVVPDNPALRTFRIVRRPADGLAYAMAIAQKYRLTYDSIMERIKS
jgi:DNA mismatch repair protein MutS